MAAQALELVSGAQQQQGHAQPLPTPALQPLIAEPEEFILFPRLALVILLASRRRRRASRLGLNLLCPRHRRGLRHRCDARSPTPISIGLAVGLGC